jgi:hypothetical protein
VNPIGTQLAFRGNRFLRWTERHSPQVNGPLHRQDDLSHKLAAAVIDDGAFVKGAPHRKVSGSQKKLPDGAFAAERRFSR